MTEYTHHKSFSISRKISIGIILSIFLHTLSTIWWAAKLDERILHQEEWIDKNAHLSNMVSRLEERIVSLQNDVNELQERINHEQ